MKTTNFPPLRVTPALRKAAESVLLDGESLSSFMQQALQLNVDRRRLQKEFIRRGLRARKDAARTGVYVAEQDVLAALDSVLARADKKTRTRK